MTGKWWTLIDAVALLSFVVSFITSFVPTWNAAFDTLSPGMELAWLVWALTRFRRLTAADDHPYPSQPIGHLRGR